MTGKKIQTWMLLISLISALGLSQCTSYDFSRRIIQQGNLLPLAKIQRIKIGMNKNEVAILMGTSLLSPMFNNERWDYAYTRRRGNGPLILRHVSLYFSGDRLVRIAHKPSGPRLSH